MLVLLGISSVIAVFVPAPKVEPTQEEKATSGASGTTGATGASGTTGATGTTGTTGQGTKLRDAGPIEAEIKPDDKKKTVKAAPGDRLVLTVDPGRDADVEIPDLGLIATTTEYAPVVFDIQLPPVPGRYEVVEIGRGPLATIKTSGPQE